MLGRVLNTVGIDRVALLAEAGPLALPAFSDFDFSGIELTLPNRTFQGELELRVGDKKVFLIEVGPAHTRGDAVVWVPGDKTLFTGDILFKDAHPIIWQGSGFQLDRSASPLARHGHRDRRSRSRSLDRQVGPRRDIALPRGAERGSASPLRCRDERRRRGPRSHPRRVQKDGSMRSVSTSTCTRSTATSPATASQLILSRCSPEWRGSRRR